MHMCEMYTPFMWLFVGKLLVVSFGFYGQREKSAEFFDAMCIFAYHFISNIRFFATAHRFFGFTNNDALN